MNALYTKAKDAILKGEIDLITDSIKAVLIDAGAYTNNIVADQFLSDIPAGARVATSPDLTGKVVSGGVFIADGATLTAVTGAQSEALVLYKDTGTETTSQLLVYIDTATYLPITPNGGDIIIDWNGGTGEILSI